MEFVKEFDRELVIIELAIWTESIWVPDSFLRFAVVTA